MKKVRQIATTDFKTALRNEICKMSNGAGMRFMNEGQINFWVEGLKISLRERFIFNK